MPALLNPNAPLLLNEVVNDLLQTSQDLQVRQVHCQTSGSELVLRGCVASFDTKQLAQHIATAACGMRQISNEIVVLPG
ncbi:MAG: BON domain-containing protein [Planctomycetales bacterium]|nr:BON domain-containing protein [Planctomycetales bacterium]